MALYYDLPVYKDVYRLILTIFEYTKGSLGRFDWRRWQDVGAAGKWSWSCPGFVDT